jgi:hypothetical protein
MKSNANSCVQDEITAARTTDSGACFRVEVSNPRGIEFSQAAKLTVKVSVAPKAIGLLDADAAAGAEVLASSK